MDTKTKNQTKGALAPQKEKLFSITETRMKIVNSAPREEIREVVRRQRIRAD